MRVIVFFLPFLLTSLLRADEVLVKEYYFYSLEKSKPAFDYRINEFSNFFGDSLLAENKDAMFLFYEYKGIQRLVVFNSEKSDKMSVFQIPETKILPYLHPEQYMKERERLQKSGISREKCMKLGIDGGQFLSQLGSLQLDSHLYVRPYFENENFSHFDSKADNNHLIMGFSQRAGIRRYFYYLKYDGFWEQQPEYFSVYAKVFDVVEALNRTISFPECR